MKDLVQLITEEMNGPLFDENGFSEQLEGFVQYVVVPGIYKRLGSDVDIDVALKTLSEILFNNPVENDLVAPLKAFVQEEIIQKLYQRLQINPNSRDFRKAVDYIAYSLGG